MRDAFALWAYVLIESVPGAEHDRRMHEPKHHRMTRAVGTRMRELRHTLGISQQDLAELSEVHITSVGRIERGEGNPSLDTMTRLATALDTTLADLVTLVTPDLVHHRETRVTVHELRRAREAQLAPQTTSRH